MPFHCGSAARIPCWEPHLIAVTLLVVVTLTGCTKPSVRLEAEDARLTGLETTTATPGFSGQGYVTGFDRDDDRLVLNYQAAAGPARLRIRYRTPFGEKGYSIQINGLSGNGMLPDSGKRFARQNAGTFLLRDGENSLVMNKGWGWFEVDAFDFTPVKIVPPKPVTARLTDRHATPSARRLYEYLTALYGRKTLAGQQDLADLAWIREQTGSEPAVAGLDFMDYSPSRVERGARPQGSTERAIDWVRGGGGILTYCWHWNAPCDLLDEPGGKEWYKGFYAQATTFDLAAALADPKGERYHLLLRDIDVIAGELRKFADADIPILWRPLHEAQGGWFWWGAKGHKPFVQLWRLLYRRLTEHHGLHHLIWVYSPPADGLADRDWYPGDKWVDVFAPDIYAGGRAPMSDEWEAARALVKGRKLVALGECGAPPEPALSRAFQTRWSWFITWSGSHIRNVPADTLRKVFHDEDVITRNELPAWTRPTPERMQQESLRRPPSITGSPLGPGDHDRSLMMGDRKRDYLIHIPKNYDPEKPVPVILALHGAAMNGSMMVWFSGLNEKADEAGFVVVYPSGSGIGPFRTWNAGGFKGWWAEGRTDDVAFLDRLLDQLGQLVNVDGKRVYACGMSNGAMMCYRLAAELSERIAAIAPVAGTIAIEESKPKRPVPVIHFHGTQDALVPFEAAKGGTPAFLTLKGVKESIRTWVKLNGCDEKATAEVLSKDGDAMKVTRLTYGGGKDGAEVVLVTIEGGGHTWPGQQPPVPFIGKSATNISANDLMWAFFQKHTLK